MTTIPKGTLTATPMTNRTDPGIAFHPSLATVGVLLAVFGYVVGTYGAMLTAELMRIVAP